MSPLQAVPLFIAIPVAIMVVLGSTLTLIGALGFARLTSFYDRLHAPTLATSWGTGGIIIASALMFSVIEGRAVIHEFVIGLCIVVTTPVTLMMLARAALQRDRAERSPVLPEDMQLRPQHPEPPAQG
ncbi:monovalent cation/H(+) antiporter subunit G [Paracoccus benzoatiresistens]|uniref:Monovalent cation/H(+) antiporter subunit G n=1 Tax=Paracoccus benzoatiresistens TaxID=2997341 RepID=A0ABT4J495_9RHOB|nr:monovalent cation/H(+) antiporter subunit G [Paracoccus sp. EF6]MCZ0961930.1 monovalent cation/H(+) antiporter subunit G [Paracoccus sp. EF6]